MYTKCCVPGCANSRKEALLHKFPKCQKRLQMWLDSINCDSLRKKSAIELVALQVCHRHFEARFVTKKLRILSTAYPTLIMESEVLSGKPLKPPTSDVPFVPEGEHCYSKKSHIDHNYCKDSIPPSFLRTDNDRKTREAEYDGLQGYESLEDSSINYNSMDYTFNDSSTKICTNNSTKDSSTMNLCRVSATKDSSTMNLCKVSATKDCSTMDSLTMNSTKDTSTKTSSTQDFLTKISLIKNCSITDPLKNFPHKDSLAHMILKCAEPILHLGPLMEDEQIKEDEQIEEDELVEENDNDETTSGCTSNQDVREVEVQQNLQTEVADLRSALKHFHGHSKYQCSEIRASQMMVDETVEALLTGSEEGQRLHSMYRQLEQQLAQVVKQQFFIWSDLV